MAVRHLHILCAVESLHEEHHMFGPAVAPAAGTPPLYNECVMLEFTTINDRPVLRTSAC
jgi:hypothetical protein